MESNNLPVYGCYACGHIGTNFTKLSEIRAGIGNLVCPNCQSTAADPIGMMVNATTKEIQKLRKEIQDLKDELINLRYTVKTSGYRSR